MRVAVLGAGIQGACTALELALNSVEVDLYEKSDRPLDRASSHNEGKIHLGYVYANDRTLRTTQTMAKGAVVFQRLMRRWLGRAVDAIPVSAPFYYVVHRDSLLSETEIEAHLRAARAILVEETGHGPVDYFGHDYREAPVRLSRRQCQTIFNERWATAAYRTPEIGIDSEALAALIRVRLVQEPKIRCQFETSVSAVSSTNGRATVEFEIGGKKRRASYDHVVNTLWDGRLAIDQTLGIKPPRPWLYRIKHYLRLRCFDEQYLLPTTTIVLGPYGDIVTYNNREVFLSWYPAGMKGLSCDLKPPPWPLTLEPVASRQVRDEILQGLATIVPAVAQLPAEAIESSRTKAGIIFAWGSTDIPDIASGLHERYAVGPQSYGRYHSIDTGKLTMAPYFAKLLADRILQKE
jgi:glycine/D-amino acid oxidase-like deaminating enzyme